MKVKALRNVSYQGLSLMAGGIMDIPENVYLKIQNDVEVINPETEKETEKPAAGIMTSESFKEEIQNKKLKNIKRK